MSSYLAPLEGRRFRFRAARNTADSSADMFRDLVEPGRLPEYTSHLLGGGRDGTVARLVLAGDLQIETESGDFVHGAAAIPHLFGRLPDRLSPPAENAVVRASQAAIHYGVALGALGAGNVASRIYRFNTEPRAPHWERALGDSRKVRAWLGVARLSGRQLGPYVEGTLGQRDPWVRWHLRGRTPGTFLHKIYVSPRAADLPDVLQSTFALCRAMGVPSLKVGRTLDGVLRSDKLVLYLQTMDTLRLVGDELVQLFGSLPAAGVPFTTPLDAQGLLSWAVDPAPKQLGGPATTSWRMFVASRLEVALRTASTTTSQVAMLAMLEWSLRLDGIEPIDWSWEPAN